jgi:phosphoribosylformylglycinamidine cyclo-ligase
MGTTMTKNNSLTYADAGVDIDAGNTLVEQIKPAAKSTNRPGVMDSLGGFGAMFDLKAAGFKDPILVSATDGVGTKLRIAIDTQNLDTVGIDLVAMCVNDLICQGAIPLFFLDYFATGKLEVNEASKVINGIAEGCRQANTALVGGETAEMPGMYDGKDFDLAGFAVGAMERGETLPRNVSNGDVLIGMPSSGIHSNGYSLVRKIVENSGHSWNDDCPFGEGSLAKHLLEPTKIYVKSAVSALKTGKLKALAHITGGGLTENLPRALPEGLGANINLDAWDRLPIFNWLIEQADLKMSEALKSFNCGIGMIAICSADDLIDVISALKNSDCSPTIIGEITNGTGVSYSGKL